MKNPYDCAFVKRQGICRRLPGSGVIDPECEMEGDSCKMKAPRAKSAYDCAFVKRQGICRRIPGNGVIDPECEMEDDSCKMKASEIEIPIKRSVKRSPVVVRKTPTLISRKSPVIARKTSDRESPVPPPGTFLLSGPVSAYAGEYEGVKYYFFGDAHFSLKNKCPGPCKDIDVESGKILNPDSIKCMDISGLLDYYFTKGEYVDFYIETPFQNRDLILPLSIRPHDDYLSKLRYIFRKCLNKLGCPYSKTRFHYVDTRSKWVVSDLPGLLYPPEFKNAEKEFYDLIKVARERGIDVNSLDISHIDNIIIKNMHNITTDMKTYIYSRIKKIESIIIEMLMNEENKRSHFIENTHILMTAIYGSNRTMSGISENLNSKISRFIMESDDYINDVEKAIDPLLKKIDPKTEDIEKIKSAFIEYTHVSSTKEKIQHRTRKQLYMLEKEGNKDISDKIKKFMSDIRSVRKDDSQIIKLWNDFYKTYEYFSGKIPSSDLYLIKRRVRNIIKILENLASILDETILSGTQSMDVYTLARMFRTFPGVKTHIPSTRRIVYAGNKHIEIYVLFFKKYLGVDIESYDIKYVPKDPNKKEEDKKEDKEEDQSNPYIRCFPVNASTFLD